MAIAAVKKASRAQTRRVPAPFPVRLSHFEQRLFAEVVAVLVAAKAKASLADGLLTAHRIQDAAIIHVIEWRTRVKADRMRRRARAKRRAGR